MASNVNVGQILGEILAGTMGHLRDRHGDKVALQLFFELYNQTFNYLERELGFEAVQAYWKFISDQQMSVLENLVRTKGFEGMAEYWRNTLGQEGAQYEMDVKPDAFHVVVSQCPPVQWLKSRKLPLYGRYCDHCEVLYRRVLERCGYEVRYIAPDPKTGSCCGLHVTQAKAAQTTGG